VQKDREVEVINSFELVASVDAASGAITLEQEYLSKKSTQFKEVFKTLDVLVRHKPHEK
jgi:hypothetical protein